MSKKNSYILIISQNETPHLTHTEHFNMFVSAFLSVPGIFTFLPPLPLVTSCERRPLLLCSHRLFDAVVEPTVSGLAVAVTMAAALR